MFIKPVYDPDGPLANAAQQKKEEDEDEEEDDKDDSEDDGDGEDGEDGEDKLNEDEFQEDLVSSCDKSSLTHFCTKSMSFCNGKLNGPFSPYFH